MEVDTSFAQMEASLKSSHFIICNKNCQLFSLKQQTPFVHFSKNICQVAQRSENPWSVCQLSFSVGSAAPWENWSVQCATQTTVQGLPLRTAARSHTRAPSTLYHVYLPLYHKGLWKTCVTTGLKITKLELHHQEHSWVKLALKYRNHCECTVRPTQQSLGPLSWFVVRVQQLQIPA